MSPLGVVFRTAQYPGFECWGNDASLRHTEFPVLEVKSFISISLPEESPRSAAITRLVRKLLNSALASPV